MRYLIMGAGALGSVFGGLLSQAGRTVAFMGRGDHFARMKAKGLIINGLWGEFHLGPVTEPEPDSGALYDIILLCIKSFDTEEACRELDSYLAPDGLVISVQNGLGNLEIIARRFGKERTIGARIIFGAQVKHPGTVTVTVYADKVLLGAISLVTSRDRLAAVAADLNAAGIPTRVVEDIHTHIWGKVLYNCALNPLGAILGVPYGSLADNPETRQLMCCILEEIYQVAAARGVTLSNPTAAAYFHYFLENLVPPTATHWPSMWQDLQAGRRTEIEALNGAICRYGRETGVATPYNDAISRLMRFLEASGRAGASGK